MCGIAGYIGHLDANSVLFFALERLRYRGYDSAGIASLDKDNDIVISKTKGKFKELEEQLNKVQDSMRCGIAHTRWATHGIPSTANSHPHDSEDKKIAVVHNGIIENYEHLKNQLMDDGVIFKSETDTEVIPHLLKKYYDRDPIEAVKEILPLLKGSYAFAVIFADFPDRIIAVRKGSPLMIGRSEKHKILASDVPALLPHATECIQMLDGEIADISKNDIIVYDEDGSIKETNFEKITVDDSAVSKGDYDFFMEKEIAEQPTVLETLLNDRILGHEFTAISTTVDLKAVKHIVFLACGTSWHAALLGKRFIEKYARIHVEVDISSEYRYRNPIASGDTLIIAISQSGETADTLASLRLARSMFMPVISLVNVVESTIARESDAILPLLAGPEIGVASTKAYTVQVMALYILALQLAKIKGLLGSEEEVEKIEQLKEIPNQVEETLKISEESVKECAELLYPAQATVFLGRGGEHPTAIEGALKLKEIAYIHAMGYAAGEFKHGPIALITDSMPVVCIAPRDEMFEKIVSNLEEVKARSGRIIALGYEDDAELKVLSDHYFPIKKASCQDLQPLLSILPLQLYSMEVAIHRGCDVDQPRNLAKSVTVE